jgi:hypothetical protein
MKYMLFKDHVKKLFLTLIIIHCKIHGFLTHQFMMNIMILMSKTMINFMEDGSIFLF